MNQTKLRTGIMLAAAAAALVALPGCRGERTNATPRQFFPDMDDQKRWDPLEATGFFDDHRTARITPEHTVPFAAHDFAPPAGNQAEGKAWLAGFAAEREAMLAADDGIYRGVEVLDDGTEAYLDYIPVRVTREMIEHGREQFNIYCSACHGYAGDGRGMVGVRWAYLPANLMSETYRDRSQRQGKDGYLFHTILNGVWAPDGANRMPPYSHALSEMEAWSVVAYLRALQRSRGSAWADLPPDDQARLGRPTPAEPAAENGAGDDAQPESNEPQTNGGAS